ncbi:MAG: hypothetical protein RL367_114, partial [Pseudomonadota bacterium]
MGNIMSASRYALIGLALIAAKPVTVYSGGPIITMAGDVPETVEALAVAGDRIIAVGTKPAVEKRAGKKALQLDLKGRTLLPGFIDAHGHVSFVGQNAGMVQLQPPPVGGVDSISKLQVAFGDWAAAHRGAPALIGNGYDDS